MEKDIKINQISSEIEEETSKTVIAIRFLLMVFIVFIHSNAVTSYWDENSVEHLYDIPLVANVIILFFTQILSRCAVPLFFMISGYLCYEKNYSYSVLIKKKMRSLVIPFFIWPILYLILFFIRTVLFHVDNPYMHLKLSDWFSVFIGKYNFNSLPTNPTLVFQFWYIRDLILLFLISPVLKRILDKKPFLLIFFVILLWMQKSNFYHKNASQGICFFVIGMYFSKQKVNISNLNFISIKEVLLILLILCPVDIYLLLNENELSICHEFNILVLSVLILKIGYWIQSRQKFYDIQKFLADYSFWMFALHQPILQPLIINVYKRCLSSTIIYGGGWKILEFFITSFITVFVCVITGFLMKKIFPNIFKIMVGGR